MNLSFMVSGEENLEEQSLGVKVLVTTCFKPLTYQIKMCVVR